MTDSASRGFVEVDSLRYRYRSARSWALDEASFQAERGRVLGLVGPNGSGKTTLFRLILGFMPPQSGRVSVGGEEPAAYRTSCGIGYLPEQVRLPGNVRVRELAVLMGRLAGLRGIELDGAIDRYMSILAIEEKADALVSTLSHGYRQRVGLLAALLGEPALILLDEPANGLDPTSVGILRSVLRRLRREGQTVIVSSHNLLELERVCDEVIILRHGTSLGRSSRAELGGRPDIWVVQLGAERAAEMPEVEVLCREAGGVCLAADEAAFTDERAARSYAERIDAVGGAVETVERRPFNLEFLFHSLVQDAGEEQVN
jgi:ABC-2 type transport system ATP-binding protein